MQHLQNLIDGTRAYIREAKIIANKQGLEVGMSHGGGIDSTVLWHIAQQEGIKKAFYFNTGVEEKENIKFMKKQKGIVWIRPKKTFKQICFNDGFPIGSKEVAKAIHETMSFFNNPTKDNVTQAYKRLVGSNRLGLGVKSLQTRFSMPLWAYEAISKKIPLTSKCCNGLKKDLIKYTTGYNLVGEMMADSQLRESSIKTLGVVRKNKATPLAHWTKADIWLYIWTHELEISKHYSKPNVTNSGCISCFMGYQFDMKDGLNRMEQIHKPHYPKQYKAHMSYKHKSGWSFGDAVKAMDSVLMDTDFIMANSKKLELLISLRDHLQGFSIEHNKILLGSLIIHTRKVLEKRIRVKARKGL